LAANLSQNGHKRIRKKTLFGDMKA